MRKIGAVALVILTMVACGSQENVDTNDIQQDHPAPTSGIDLSQSTSTREVDSVTENTSNITSICENEYFPVVLGAYWVYDVKYEQADGSSYRLYLRHEVVEVNPDTFYVHDQNLSFTPEFEPLPSQLSHEGKNKICKMVLYFRRTIRSWRW